MAAVFDDRHTTLTTKVYERRYACRYAERVLNDNRLGSRTQNRVAVHSIRCQSRCLKIHVDGSRARGQHRLRDCDTGICRHSDFVAFSDTELLQDRKESDTSTEERELPDSARNPLTGFWFHMTLQSEADGPVRRSSVQDSPDMLTKNPRS